MRVAEGILYGQIYWQFILMKFHECNLPIEDVLMYDNFLFFGAFVCDDDSAGHFG